MPTRRDFTQWTLVAPALAALNEAAFAQTSAAAVGAGQAISRDALIAFARDVSRAPYQAPRADIPRAFLQLTPDQHRQIQMRPQARVWSGENRGVTVEFLHPGNVFTTPVIVRTVENGLIQDQRFSVDAFDYGAIPPPPADATLPFTGFRARAAMTRPDMADEFLTFQGASFFRGLARGQVFGVLARALILNLGENQGEEFPAFRAFWIERPSVGATSLVVHALLDSESVTGLYRFSIRPGDTTVCDVEATLFPRVDLSHVGVAPLSANFLFAPHDRMNVDDVRSAAHDVNGLQIWNGAGEWLWRPVQNPETLQISAFVDQNPRGFGLIQRDRRIEAFNDVEARYERRPSVWIEPLGDWGQGQVQLVEIPVNDDFNRNIVTYWRPRQALARGGEHSFTYRMHWCWTPPDRPSAAVTVMTRSGRGGAGRRRRFLVDFAAEEFADPLRGQGLRVALTANRGRVNAVDGRVVPELRLYRVTFDLDPEANAAVELRLVLERDGQAQSETWLYRWTP